MPPKVATRSAVGAVVIVLALAPPRAAARSVGRVRLDVEATRVRVREAFGMDVVCQDTDVPDAAPEVPDVPGLSIALTNPTPSQSSITNIINTRVQTQVTYTYRYRVIPLRAGSFRIPPITVKAGGRTYRTQPVTITVTAAPGSDEYLFVELSVDKKTLYVTESLTATLRVGIRKLRYGNQEIRAGNLLRILDPDSSELSIFRQDLLDLRSRRSISSVLTPEEVLRKGPDGKTHKFVVYDLQVPLRAEQSGTFSVGPVVVAADYPVRLRTDLFGRLTVVRTKHVVAGASSINILAKSPPLQGRPDDYGGAVGRFQMRVVAKPTRVRLGEPITITVRISGDGYIEGVAGPDLLQNQPLTDRFELPNEEMTGVLEKGAKVFTQSIFPKKAGRQRIPPITWTYFDSAKHSYQTLRSDPIPIEVLPGAAPAGPLPGRSSDEDVQRGLTVIKTGILPNYADMDEVLVSQVLTPGWGWAAYAAACPFLYLLVWLIHRHTDRLRQDVAFARRQQARKSAEQALAKARKIRDGRGRCRAVQRAVLDYVADRRNLPPAGLTRQGAVDELIRTDVPDDLTREFDELLNLCEMAEYAGMDQQNPDSLLQRAQACIRALEKARL